MAVEKSYARLGLFLVMAAAVIVATALFFIHRMQKQEVIAMVTYTTSNVTGLDVGSPVRFRGVPVGSVADLRIEPRGSLIEVDFDIFVDRLTERGSNVEAVKRQASSGMFAGHRASIVSNPVTGEAYVLIDQPGNPSPSAALPFTPSRVYVPFMPTALGTVADRLPELLDRAASAMGTLESVLSTLPGNIERSDRFFTNVERVIRESNLPAMSADSRKFFAATTEQMERITSDLDKTLGPSGTLAKFVEDTNTAIAAANLEATTKSTREAMNQSTLAADDLRRSLPAMRDALAQLRDLARLLEEQPESMVYGPRPTKGKK